MKRKATAIWKGTGMEGVGTLHTQSGIFNNQPYSFKTRFKNDDGKLGTNPEELIAAAHAGCFSMALSFQLNNAGFTAEELTTNAELTMVNEGGWVIKSIVLKLSAKIPGIKEDIFLELAEKAKAGCPISKLLNTEIILQAHLEG